MQGAIYLPILLIVRELMMMSVAFSRLGNGSTTAGCRWGGFFAGPGGLQELLGRLLKGNRDGLKRRGITGSYWCGDSLRTDGEGKKASHLHRAAGAPTFAPLELHHPVIKVRTWVIRTD